MCSTRLVKATHLAKAQVTEPTARPCKAPVKPQEYLSKFDCFAAQMYVVIAAGCAAWCSLHTCAGVGLYYECLAEPFQAQVAFSTFRLSPGTQPSVALAMAFLTGELLIHPDLMAAWQFFRGVWPLRVGPTAW